MRRVEIIITRHPALVQLLKELGVADEKTELLTHVTDPSVLDGKVVAGVLPLHLAARCKEVWTPELELKPEDRGRELSLEELKERFRGLRGFVVREVNNTEEDDDDSEFYELLGEEP